MCASITSEACGHHPPAAASPHLKVWCACTQLHGGALGEHPAYHAAARCAYASKIGNVGGCAAPFAASCCCRCRKHSPCGRSGSSAPLRPCGAHGWKRCCICCRKRYGVVSVLGKKICANRESLRSIRHRGQQKWVPAPEATTADRNRAWHQVAKLYQLFIYIQHVFWHETTRAQGWDASSALDGRFPCGHCQPGQTRQRRTCRQLLNCSVVVHIGRCINLRARIFTHIHRKQQQQQCWW